MSKAREGDSERCSSIVDIRAERWEAISTARYGGLGSRLAMRISLLFMAESSGRRIRVRRLPFASETDNEMRMEPIFHSFLGVRAFLSFVAQLRTIKRLERSYRANFKKFCRGVLVVIEDREI